jgi:hypothetical protein
MAKNVNFLCYHPVCSVSLVCAVIEAKKLKSLFSFSSISPCSLLVVLPSRLMNMAVPVSFFHRDLALGRGLLKAAAAEATAGLTVSAVPLPELLATGACALAALDSLAAIEAAKTTAAKLVPEDGAVDGTAKIFIEAKSG